VRVANQRPKARDEEDLQPSDLGHYVTLLSGLA